MTAPSSILNVETEASAQERWPHNIEAEQILLGLLLIDNTNFDRVADFLSSHHFYDPLHGRIYGSMSRLIGKGHLADPTTLKVYFEHDEALKEIGGISYLNKLAAFGVPYMNAGEYGRVVHNLSVLRDLMRIGTDIYERASKIGVDEAPETHITLAEQALYEVAERGRYESGFQSFDKALALSLHMMESAFKRDGRISGVPTGFKDIDELLGGLQNSDLVILAGRPSMGKTALATNIAFNAAKNYREERLEDGSIQVAGGAVVGFFSLEMSAEQLATRLLAEQTGIASEKVRRGKIRHDDFTRLMDAAQILEDIPLYIDDTGGLTLATLAARARRLKRQANVGLLVIDYLQLLSGDARRHSSESRVQEITQITTGLKALAKELNIPILALSQLSRQVEAREDKRPQLADLRESGSIEQDADVVAFIFREEYYLSRRQPREGTPEHEKWQEEMAKITNIAEFIVGKQRHGPTGTIRLHFESSITRFSNLEKYDY